MSEPPPSPALVGRRTMEIVAGLVVVALGALVIADSLRVGIGWASDGPRSGYFPFRVALVMIGAALFVVTRAVLAGGAKRGFVSRDEFRRVATVLVPSVAFVVGVFVVGLYVSAALFIGVFMLIQGDRRWLLTAAVALGVPSFAYAMFEMWFLVPLPKGPLEDLLGL
jgi:hypothetical protein